MRADSTLKSSVNLDDLGRSHATHSECPRGTRNNQKGPSVVSLRKAIVVMAASLGIGFIANPAAYASGSFTWNVHLKCCIDSRTWAQNSGSTKIYSNLACEPNMGGHYKITCGRNSCSTSRGGRSATRAAAIRFTPSPDSRPGTITSTSRR
jgi:hypothetical protein